MRAQTLLCCELALVTCMAALAPTVRAQDGPPLGFITKRGEELDVRSGGRVLADELAALGRIILPDLDSPVAGTDTVPQIHLRGGNVQANSTTEDLIQIFTGSYEPPRAKSQRRPPAATSSSPITTPPAFTSVPIRTGQG